MRTSPLHFLVKFRIQVRSVVVTDNTKRVTQRVTCASQ